MKIMRLDFYCWTKVRRIFISYSSNRRLKPTVNACHKALFAPKPPEGG